MNGRIDHIVIGADNLISGTRILENKLNTKLLPGGEHKVMGTHNKLLKLQTEIYFEVISINPNVDPPSQPRWFSLDELDTKEKIKKSPRSLCWVLAVDNIEDAVHNCGYYPGEILQLSRGDLTWKVTVPSDGALIGNGVFPFLIEWPKNIHPSKNLSNSTVTLNKISLFHPEVNNTRNIINNLIQSDLINISKGLPKLEFHLTNKNRQIIID